MLLPLLTLVTSTSSASSDLPYPENSLIAYKADKPKASLLVYTDIDCGYCRKLHNEIPDLNASGVSVYYAPFPRAGLNSKSYKKIVTVYCADDRQKALTKAKHNFILPTQSCDNPVKTIYEDGLTKGVRGTPMVLTSDNRTIGGYKTAKAITKELGLTYVPANDAQRQAFQPLNFTQQEMPDTYYKAEKRISLYLQPSNEQKEMWRMGRGNIKVMSVVADVEGEQWVGTVYKGKTYYAPASQLNKLSEKNDYSTQETKGTNYVATVDANVYVAPDQGSQAVDKLPANRYTKFTFEYEEQGMEWLGYESQGVKYFIARKDLELKQ